MYLPEERLQKVLQKETRFEENGHRLFVEVLPVGELSIPSGEIFLADPYEMNRGIMVIDQIEPGKYPAILHFLHEPPHDDKVSAFFVVRFQDKPATRFEMCLPPDATPESVPGDNYYGIHTMSGNVSIADKEVVHSLITDVTHSAEMMESLENQIALTYFDCGGFANVELPNGEDNFMTITATGEEGGFPAFIAYNEDEPVALILDFMAL